MSDKTCWVCGHDLCIEATLKTADGEISLCPNHTIAWALGISLPGATKDVRDITPPVPQGGECALCEKDAVATVQDFKFDKGSTPIQWHMCEEHLRACARRNLDVKSVVAMRECVPETQTFLTHDDFYDEEGNAIQPH